MKRDNYKKGESKDRIKKRRGEQKRQLPRTSHCFSPHRVNAPLPSKRTAVNAATRSLQLVSYVEKNPNASSTEKQRWERRE